VIEVSPNREARTILPENRPVDLTARRERPGHRLHRLALLVDPVSGTIADLEGDGPVLGIDADISFREHHAPFDEPGRVLALCTDGITEAGNEEGEQFGRGRLKQSLLRHASGDASVILDGVMRDVFDFRGTAPRSDDLTLVVLKRAP
jgi:sigma-B regulation protein RsbU (phosphoserine phosphatase)